MNDLRYTVPVWLITLTIMAALLLSLTPLAGAQGNAYTLTVLHTNDVHARILQFGDTGGACGDEDAAQGNCFGGVARRATKINEIRAEGGNLILVDAGDQFQGTLFYNKYKGEEAQTFMNELGYNAMTVGNHEFDDGPGVLGSFIRGADFPVVSANIDASNEAALAGLIQPYTVLDVGGEKIGVVGYTTEDTAILSSPGPDVAFNNIEDSVAAAVAELEAMGINKIVALSHAGFARDRQVAAAVDGLDVIVAGHTNTYLSNTDESAEGPYPVVIDAPSGDPVLLVSDFTWGKYLGRLDVTFDSSGVPISWEGNPITLDASVPEDPAILAEAQALNQPLEELRSQIVGSAAVDLNGDRATCRFEECNMGNLITDAVLWQTATEGTQIALMNGGGIRASIAAGDVSLGDVLEVLPFGNTIATFELKGADVWAALENGVSRAENPENEGTGRFPQVAGLRFTWNPDLPVGSRVVSVEVKGPNGSYSPIDLNATYKLAANDFMRGGGDDYSVFAERAINPYDFGPNLDEAVANYIAAQSPVAPTVEGRITQNAQATPAELPGTGGAPIGLPIALSAAGFALIGTGMVVRRRQGQRV
jgi:5'-nucleotidase/UDP-sugar diphosphatase